ncbi:DNA cytosine methyltransferase [Vibrio breoganii]|uniref:DNA cytosine methyltransferase n=1 Tax=Vibrio breoganii TaxID=553239 RepID=UPI0010BD706A|nr:DNA cytosine methyltransferase [Vibrio breoganii]TKF90338.1 DNA cytosine methyltransferase [Vibrio breoganii]
MNIISLFSGAGGFDLGLINAGHNIVWANDILIEAVETYKANIGDHIVHEDITKVDFSEVPDADAMIGGFPCQGFSIANMNRKRDDPRNVLYLEYLRALETKKPKYFIAENVRGILSLDKGEVFKKIVEDFEACGYNVQYQLLNASDYGIPQNRYRVFIFGVRKDIDKIPKFEFTPTHGKKLLPKATIGEALENIPEPEEEHSLSNHVYSKFKLKKNGYINHRNVDPNKPSPTVTARGDNKGGAMINHHPNNHRRLSVRETATIQTFPLDFEFKGNMTMCYLQVGNAVPPMLAKMLGEFLNHHQE